MSGAACQVFIDPCSTRRRRAASRPPCPSNRAAFDGRTRLAFDRFATAARSASGEPFDRSSRRSGNDRFPLRRFTVGNMVRWKSDQAMPFMGEVTLLIGRARDGDREAFDRIFELLYPELRRIAHRRLTRGVRDGIAETTALVNECYLKFLQRDSLTPADRAHFLAYSATVMRSIIVDAARGAHADRRGGVAADLELDTEIIESVPAAASEILDVHAALEDLRRVDARLARVVEMRYFGGMDDGEIGEALGLSTRTVSRDWEKARLLLADALHS